MYLHSKKLEYRINYRLEYRIISERLFLRNEVNGDLNFVLLFPLGLVPSATSLMRESQPVQDWA